MAFPVQPSDHLNFINNQYSQNDSPTDTLCSQLQNEPMSKEQVTSKLSFLSDLEKTSSDPHTHAEIRTIKDLMSSSLENFKPQSDETNQLIDSLQRLPV